MLNYDALQNPVQPNRKGAATSLNQAQTYLDQHPYDIFEESDLTAVSICTFRKILLLFFILLSHNVCIYIYNCYGSLKRLINVGI